MPTRGHTSDLAALAIAACLAPLLLIAGLFVFSTQIDYTARLREEATVAHGLQTRIHDIERSVVPQAVWNDAQVNTLAGNQAWMRDNVGVFFMGTSDYELAAVFSPDNTLTYAVYEGAERNTLPEALNSRFAPLIADIRTREARLAPITDRIAQGRTLSEPVQASAIVSLSGRHFLLSATLVQPDTDPTLWTPVSPVLAVAEEMDSKFVAELGERLLMPDLSLIPGPAPRGLPKASIPVLDARGKRIGSLLWQPQSPGSRLLGAAWPFLLLVSSVLAGAAYFAHRQTMRAVKNLVNSEQRARHLALHDQLTELPNRAQLSEELNRALSIARREGIPFAIHCLDLDRFKEVNDTYGHPVGDELIRVVAQLLPSVCRTGDIVARLGGDEFAIIQRNTTPRGAAELAERIIGALRAPVDLSAGRVFTGCSIGIGVITREMAQDPQECLRMADLALYRAKDEGRGGYAFFEPEMDAAIKARRRLQADLRTALKEGALSLNYQPQFNASNDLIGLEALARWTHPTQGPISPGVFIPVAEECGLIEEIGWFAMRRAFEDGARWPGLKIAINVSAAQLRVKDFVDRVEELACDIGIDPTRFELEITEGLLLANTPETHETLRRLRAIGFSIALDDFGTGYSSLSYLQRFPITRIKIDRSFVANLGVDPEAEDVVAAIVRLAQALSLSIIAEGVETEDQRARLSAAGCGDIQGFLVGRPLPIDQIEVLIRERRARARVAA